MFPVVRTAIVLSTQHLDASMTSADVADLVKPYIYEVMPEGWITDETIWHINPTGKFVIGGPDGDSGLTGVKLLLIHTAAQPPTAAAHFLEKTQRKLTVAQPMYLATLLKTLWRLGLPKWVNIQLSYAIGVAEPTSVYVDMGGKGNVSEEAVEKAIREVI